MRASSLFSSALGDDVVAHHILPSASLVGRTWCVAARPISQAASAHLAPSASSRKHITASSSLALASTAFSELFMKGGMAVHEGDMPTALYWLQQAAKVDPKNEQCKKMVARLEGLGIEPKEPPSIE